MRRRTHAVRILAPAFIALAALGGVLTTNGASSHAASPGVIVFASDREKLNPGEIYSLAPGSAPRDVSRSLAADYGLAVAPVGDLIAFWSGRSGTDGIYLDRSDGSRLRRVAGISSARDPGSGGPLAFSANGSVLVAVAYSDSPFASHTFVIDTRHATARPLRGACDFFPKPSPDGRLLACGRRGKTTFVDLAGHVRFTLRGSDPMWSSRGSVVTSWGTGGTQEGGSGLISDGSGRALARLDGRPLAWSPDGRLLVFARDQSLWAGNPSDLARSRELLPSWANGNLSFTPDGRYVSTETMAGKRVLVPLAGGRPIAGLDAGSGVWSRSGRLAYADFGAGPGVRRMFAVVVTDTHGRNPRVAGRFPYDDHANQVLSWALNGRRVLFLTANTCGGKGLFAVSPDGGATRRLTADPRDLETPAWSPDGTRIAYSVQDFDCHLGAGEPIHLETVGADGAGPRRVSDDGDRNLGSFDSNPSFSPDGAQIVFDHGTFNDLSLQIVATAGGVRTTLLPPGAASPGAPAWSPDGSKIAYVSDGSVKAIAPGGGTPELLATSLPAPTCGTGGLAWSPGGNQLAIGTGAGIFLVTVGDPASARLAIPVKCAGDPSFSPDGTQIAFDAPAPHPLGVQTSVMAAHVDGSGVRTLSTVPFRQSVHPSWQPLP